MRGIWKCNGDYYYVDTTWGDPVFQQEEGEDTSRDAEQNSGQDAEASGNKANISYDYMCCDDTQLFQTHILDKDTQMPECSKMDCNYYVVNGMYYTKYDAKKVLEAMNQAIWAKKSATILNSQIHSSTVRRTMTFSRKNLQKQRRIWRITMDYRR